MGRKKGGNNKVKMIGKRFGKLVVIEEVGVDKTGSITWLCECDCGNKKVIAGPSLRRSTKATKSCGCIPTGWSMYPLMSLKERASYLNYVAYYKRYFNMTEEDLRNLMDKQKGCCAICGDSLEMDGKFCLDHCHNTDRVRGYLCRLCNTGIGTLRDSVTILINAIKYLNPLCYDEDTGLLKEEIFEEII